MGVRVKLHKGCYWVFADHQYQRKAWKIGDKKKAESFAKSVRDGIGLHGALPKREKSELPTLAEYFQRFESGHMKTLREKTATGYTGAFRKYIEPSLGKLPLNELNRRTVKDFVDGLKQVRWKPKSGDPRPLARDSVRIIVACLRRILSEAVDDQLIAFNPASRLGVRYRELPKVHEIDPFSEAEAIRFMESAVEVSPYWFPYFACLFHAGLRPGEGVALRWPDVDLSRRVLHVRATVTGRRLGTTTKTGRSRQVELSEFLLSILQELLLQRKKEWNDAIPEHVFCSSAGTMADTHNIRFQHFLGVLKKAKLNPRGLHQLRHSFATLHLQNGTPIEWVSRQLGHADVSTTYKHYYHYVPERQKEKYTGALPAIGKKNTDNLIVMNAK